MRKIIFILVLIILYSCTNPTLQGGNYQNISNISSIPRFESGKLYLDNSFNGGLLYVNNGNYYTLNINNGYCNFNFGNGKFYMYVSKNGSKYGISGKKIISGSYSYCEKDGQKFLYYGDFDSNGNKIN